jgi:MFS family permease
MTDEIDKAERAGRRRARIVTVSAVVFLSTLAASQSGMRTVEQVQMLAWVAWGAMLLTILAGGGGWLQSPAVRALLNDDVTRDHRQRSLGVGFWFAMATAALIFVVDRYKPFPAQEGARIILTFGIAAALLWFGKLERGAYRDA